MKKAKKNKVTLEQWSKEHGYSVSLALASIQAGSLDLKLSQDKEEILWVETNKISLKAWAEANHFSDQQVLSWHQQELLPVKTQTDKQGKIWVQEEEILSLQFGTDFKKSQIKHLLEAYRPGVNRFIKSLWNQKGKLDAETLQRLKKTRLTERYKSQALKQALEIIVNTKKSAKALEVEASCPHFIGGAKLDSKFVTLELSQHLQEFDWCLILSTLKKHHRITIPLKGTEVLRKWLAVEGAELIQGCELTEDHIILWVKLPTLPYKPEGSVEALDLGRMKLAVDKDGNRPGPSPGPKISEEAKAAGKEGWKEILDKINRRKPGSQGRREAYRQRENYLNQTLNQMPWEDWRFLGDDNLHGIKQGKDHSTKQQRKILTSWCQRRVRDRISHKAQENRVFLVAYDPRNTSRRCPKLKGGCGMVSKANRKGEFFECQSCGYQDDADAVGAFNGFVKTLELLGSLESPKNKSIKESSSDKLEESGSS